MFKFKKATKKAEIINKVELNIINLEKRIDQLNEMKHKGQLDDIKVYLDEAERMVANTKVLMMEAR